MNERSQVMGRQRLSERCRSKRLGRHGANIADAVLMAGLRDDVETRTLLQTLPSENRANIANEIFFIFASQARTLAAPYRWQSSAAAS